ncbi:hypothetical protein AbraIFM66951_001345 [Aspergillus brasiliensis]|uniref:F-box domain-containing protein n=1 Tax=Aspergillus brasiliensis TaxID=319629 RepID=A0A9W5YXJ0_9EURO|nr:hypothetical protein AbraCBS73388_001215 [Aspergillus brasiliensis]GKZ49088.1 hypothetical protein AbraIFM66951_001345 [Aspergillus brasiliensis]
MSSLPTELFEAVLSYLDLNSIKALRLTSQSLAKRCMGPRFLGSIQQPVLDVSSETLRSLLALARNPALSKKISSLTLLAAVLDISGLENNIKDGYYLETEYRGRSFRRVKIHYTPEDLSDANRDLAWLKAQQEARAKDSSNEIIELLQLAFTAFGALDAIHLDGGVLRSRTQRRPQASGEWTVIWARAAHVFSWVTTAMALSGVAVKRLDVCHSNRKCGIPASNINNHQLDVNQAELETACMGLQSLEISLSGEIQDVLNFRRRLQERAKEGEKVKEKEKEDEKEEDGNEKTSQEKHNQAPPKKKSHTSMGQDPGEIPRTPSIFLKSAPSLRKLELSFRRPGFIDLEIKQKYDWIIHSIANEAQFPNLEECAFAGFPARSESILLFLQKHPGIRLLKIHECHLSSGSWGPIFAYVEKSMPELESLDLSNLWGRHMRNMKYVQTHVRDDNDDIREEAEDDWQESDGLVILRPIWDTNPIPRSTSYTSPRGRVVHTRRFTREEIKKGLVFRPLNKGPGRPKGSPELWSWVNERKTLYGPPA